MEATTIQKRLAAMINTKAFHRAPARKSLQMLHSVAFDKCVRYEEYDIGWGAAKVYTYSDGSVLTDDGRGYISHESKTVSLS